MSEERNIVPYHDFKPEAGRDTYVCTVCKHEVEGSWIDANGHGEPKEDTLRRIVETNPCRPEDLYKFFRYSHLPPVLQDVSRPFFDLAQEIVRLLPRCPERTIALRKLLEGKDAAVRTKVPQ